MSLFASPGDTVDVSVIVVTYNSAGSIERFIDSLRAEAEENSIRVIVVDNDSSDGTAELLSIHHDVAVVKTGGNLGYAGGINVGRRWVGDCANVLVLNPDLTIAPGAVRALSQATSAPNVAAAVPLMRDEYGELYPSLRNEPTVLTALGDALAGGRIPNRPSSTSVMVCDRNAYDHPHSIDWATGAAILVGKAAWDAVGPWDEQYFLYSEEVDYCRRIRELGWEVWFEPSASVCHVGAGSGDSADLRALMAVNTVRYIESYRTYRYSIVFRAVSILGELLRSYDRTHRKTLVTLAKRESWTRLPAATIPGRSDWKSGMGSVVIPAYDEAAVIENTLANLSPLAVRGVLEVIVVCNGCSDDTAVRARAIPGIRVHEIDEASKVAALNAGDELALLWPRVYLDADIGSASDGVLAALTALSEGALGARPVSRYDTEKSSFSVRSYYRARRRIKAFDSVLWGAGCYGMSEEGHRRLGRFPDVIADDVVVDALFDSHEKVIVATNPVVVQAPRDAESLLRILRRNHRGAHELAAADSASTVGRVIRSIRGPVTAFDAAVYLGFASISRGGRRRAVAWERDTSTR